MTTAIKVEVLAVCWSEALGCINAIPNTKDISNDCKEATVSAHQPLKH